MILEENALINLVNGVHKFHVDMNNQNIFSLTKAPNI